jgi:hypothetical protein
MFLTILVFLTVLASKLVNSVTKILFGYSLHSGWNRERVESADAGKCVHVCDIVWRTHHTVSGMTVAGQYYEFLLRHREYVGPEVLMESNITLYAVDGKRVIFVKAPDGVDVFSSAISGFSWLAQKTNAVQLLTMSLKDFVKFGKEMVGEPRSKVVMLWCSGRCGATLFLQMVERVPGVMTMSEPDFLFTGTQLFGGNAGDFDREFRDAIWNAGIKTLCKNIESDYIVIKPREE